MDSGALVGNSSWLSPLGLSLSIDEISGLPLHALVVHVAVILVPLAAVGLVATGWRPEWRKTYLLPIGLIAITGALAAILASSSGEALQDSVREAARASGTRVSFGEHPEQGDFARNMAMLFAAAVAGFWVVENWGARLRVPAWGSNASYLVSSAIAVLAVISVIIAGHSGATLVWKDVGNFVSSK